MGLGLGERGFAFSGWKGTIGGAKKKQKGLEARLFCVKRISLCSGGGH